MDSQPSWVINVAELFDQTADLEWLRRQKGACEAVLEYLLRRDSDGDGLVEMENGFAREGRASDWLDVVWASHENALVNAQMYWALGRWAECEDLLGDAAQSQRYRAAAAKLKESYNRPTADGGFWDPNKNATSTGSTRTARPMATISSCRSSSRRSATESATIPRAARRFWRRSRRSRGARGSSFGPSAPSRTRRGGEPLAVSVPQL